MDENDGALAWSLTGRFSFPLLCELVSFHARVARKDSPEYWSQTSETTINILQITSTLSSMSDSEFLTALILTFCLASVCIWGDFYLSLSRCA